MKRFLIGFFAVFFLIGCDTKPSLQKYFVEKEDNKNFDLVDLSPSLLKLDALTLSESEKAAIESFKKMNVLIFKAKKDNAVELEKESNTISQILKDTTMYQPLMKFGNNKQGIAVSFVGTDANIKEFIFYGKNEDTGFGVIRVIGDNMKPENALVLMQLMQKSNTDWSKIGEMFSSK